MDGVRDEAGGTRGEAQRYGAEHAELPLRGCSLGGGSVMERHGRP